MPLGLYSIQTQTQYIPEDYDSDNKYRFECMSTVTLSWLHKIRTPVPKFAIYARVSFSFQCWITSSKEVNLWKTLFRRYGVNQVKSAIEYISSCYSYWIDIFSKNFQIRRRDAFHTGFLWRLKMAFSLSNAILPTTDRYLLSKW